MSMQEPVERLFEDVGDASVTSEGDDYENKIRDLIELSREYERSYMRDYRENSAKYYAGIEPALDEGGRSSVIMTEVRDVVLSIMPSLLRIFTARQHIVEYIPNHEAASELAEEATDYIRYCFMEDNSGFMIIHDLLKDILIKAQGVAKWGTKIDTVVKNDAYTGLDVASYNFLLANNPNAEVVSMDTVPGPEGVSINCTLRVRKETKLLKVCSVPPEESRILPGAKSVKESRLVGHERAECISEIIKMGYDKDFIEQFKGELGSDMDWSEERAIRNRGITEEEFIHNDEDAVLFGEWWVKIDSDGDGVNEIHYIHTIGDQDVIIRDEIVETVDMAIGTPDPEPHTHLGTSIPELVYDLQRIKTNLMRNSLDSLAQTIFPRLKVLENMANIDDVLNTELGAPIRVKDMMAVDQLRHEFVGDAPLAFLNYMDQIGSKRTGISEASKGLDPKALQSTAVKGVDMVITGAQERIEMIARIIAETVFKDIFKGLLLENNKHPNPERCIKIRGKWVKVRPASYDPSMSVMVNPAIGRGSDHDRIQLLSLIKATQEMIMEKMGISNPFVTPDEYVNTITDLLSFAGFKNAERYFKRATPEQMASLSAPKPDPALLLAQNEQEKTRAKLAKDVSDKRYNERKLEMDDTFRRLQLAVQAATNASDQKATIDQQHFQGIIDIINKAVEHQHSLSEMENEQTAENAGGGEVAQGGAVGGVTQ